MTSLLDRVNTMTDLDAELANANLRGQWLDDIQLEKAIGGPKPATTPHVWRWSVVREHLDAACKVMTDSTTARRSLGLKHPALKMPGSTHSVYAAMQLVRPGEMAWAHRHSLSARRFGIEGGEDLYTVVDGERLPMHANDLILTPAFSWHDHHNDSQRDGIWLDVLDLPLVLALGQAAYEVYGERAQPQANQRGDGADAGPLTLASRWQGAPPRLPSMRYPWRAVLTQLERHARSDGSPTDGVLLEYLHPVTGESALPTLGCFVQCLRGGLSTRRHRKTASSICYVIEGEGKTVFDDQEIVWRGRDVFAIPEWTWHHHVVTSKQDRALLFVVNDAPALHKLGIYREEAGSS